MTKDKALKLAIEYLEENQHYVADNERHAYVMEYNNVIEKCKEALAQPKQEPVAWMTPTGALYRTEDVDGCFDDKHIPLYTTPPHRKSLSDEEIDLIGKRMFGAGQAVNTDRDFARAIEAAHGIKE